MEMNSELLGKLQSLLNAYGTLLELPIALYEGERLALQSDISVKLEEGGGVRRLLAADLARGGGTAWQLRLYGAARSVLTDVQAGAFSTLAELITDYIDSVRIRQEAVQKLQYVNALAILQAESKAWTDSFMEVFRKITGFDVIGFARAMDNGRFVIERAEGEQGAKLLPGLEFSASDGLLGQVALTRQVGYWERRQWEGRFADFGDKGLRLRTLIAHPVKHGTELLGVLFGGCRSEESMSEEGAELTALLSHLLASETEIRRCRERQAASTRSMAVLLNTAAAFAGASRVRDLAAMLADAVYSLTAGSFACTAFLDASGSMDQGTKEIRGGARTAAERYLGEAAVRFTVASPPWKAAVREEESGVLIELPIYDGVQLLGVLSALMHDSRPDADLLMILRMLGSAAASFALRIYDQAPPTEVLESKPKPALPLEALPRKLPLPVMLLDETRLEGLTSRERQVLQLVVSGLGNQQIAEKLYISAHTVKNHLTHIFEKLGVEDRSQAIAKAYREGLLE